METLLVAFFLYSLLFVGLCTFGVLYYLDCIGTQTYVIASAAYIVFCCLIVPSSSKAATFKYKNGRVITAKSYQEAAKLCFERETNGKYPGEDRGLAIIDMCANPKGKWVSK